MRYELDYIQLGPRDVAAIAPALTTVMRSLFPQLLEEARSSLVEQWISDLDDVLHHYPEAMQAWIQSFNHLLEGGGRRLPSTIAMLEAPARALDARISGLPLSVGNPCKAME